MAKTKSTLLDEVLAMPDSTKASTEAKFAATGRRDEVDALIDAFNAGKLSSKFTGKNGLREWVTKKLGITCSKDVFNRYVESRNGKNAQR